LETLKAAFKEIVIILLTTNPRLASRARSPPNSLTCTDDLNTMYATKPLMFIAILAVFSSVMAQRRLMAGAPIAEATLSGTKQMPPINTMTTGTFTYVEGGTIHNTIGSIDIF